MSTHKTPEWQPIETAPKDGQQIILTNGVTVAQGWWLHQDPYVRDQRDPAGVYLDQQEHDGFDGWMDCEGGMQPDPTHWMPLPPASGTTPPEQAAQPADVAQRLQKFIGEGDRIVRRFYNGEEQSLVDAGCWIQQAIQLLCQPADARLVEDANVDDLLAIVRAEVVRATQKFPTWPTDPLHASGVVQEESGELAKAVLQCMYEPHKSTEEDVRTEAIQTAAMAVRFLLSMDCYLWQPGEQHTQNALTANGADHG